MSIELRICFRHWTKVKNNFNKNRSYKNLCEYKAQRIWKMIYWEKPRESSSEIWMKRNFLIIKQFGRTSAYFSDKGNMSGIYSKINWGCTNLKNSILGLSFKTQSLKIYPATSEMNLSHSILNLLHWVYSILNLLHLCITLTNTDF